MTTEPTASRPQGIDVRALDFSTGGSTEDLTETVGESHYQENLGRLAVNLGLTRGEIDGAECRVLLQREPGNPYDPNAVRVIDGWARTLGYLSRENALLYQACFDIAARNGYSAGTCPARLYGGDDDRPSIGVWLDLKDPSTLLSDLRETFAGGAGSPTIADPLAARERPCATPASAPVAATATKTGCSTRVATVCLALLAIAYIFSRFGL